MSTKRDRLKPSYIKSLLSPMPLDVRVKFAPTLEIAGPEFHTEQNAVLRKTIRTISALYQMEKRYQKAKAGRGGESRRADIRKRG